MVYMYTFVVTNMDSSPGYLIKFYCKRGLMENFIKKSKSGFDFASVSSHTRIVNANRLQVHALAYNIFNWFRRLALSANMRKQRIGTSEIVIPIANITAITCLPFLLIRLSSLIFSYFYIHIVPFFSSTIYAHLLHISRHLLHTLIKPN